VRFRRPAGAGSWQAGGDGTRQRRRARLAGVRRQRRAPAAALSGGRGRDLGTTSEHAATHQVAPLRVALVAGEASGDLLGAGLVTALRERLPGAEFAGIGGNAMRDAGFQAWHDCSELAVMGLAEVLRHLPRLLRLRRDL